MTTNRFGSSLARFTGMAMLVGVLGLTGCDLDELLEVTDRDRVTEETLGDSALVDILVAGAFNDFTEGYGGAGLADSYVAVSGAMSDELFSSGTFTTRTATDRRDALPVASGNTSDAAYNNLQFARRSLRQASSAVADFIGTGEEYAELKALEAYTVLTLGEGFCSAVPLSFVVDGVYEYGEPMTSAQLFQQAIDYFDESSSAAASDLANVGRARALLALGQYDAAAAAVAGVPTDFAYHIYYSENAANNPIFSLQANGRWSMANREGQWDETAAAYTGTGLPYREAMDPRTPWWEDEDGGFDDDYRLFVTDRYTYYDAPIVLASGVEARLIEAEAALQGNDYAGMVGILNELRQNVDTYMEELVPGYEDIVAGTDFEDATLADLAAPTTPEAARDMLFQERGFWLYLTGHRLGDMRRQIYQYNHNVYPSGFYHKGGNFGIDVVFPIDFDETNNTLFTLDMCDVTDASIN